MESSSEERRVGKECSTGGSATLYKKHSITTGSVASSVVTTQWGSRERLRVLRDWTLLLNQNVLFFQAEDGIRDLYVTGVQTCALPISDKEWSRRRGTRGIRLPSPRAHARAGQSLRSEERRVGKECRSRWSPYH